MKIDHTGYEMYTSRARNEFSDVALFIRDARFPGVRR